MVYEAEQRTLGRRVAVKVLPSVSLLDRRYLERFQRESRTAASLEHPHIVPIFGLGEEKGIHYYAMQYIDGESLERILPEVKRLTSTEEGPARKPDETGGASLTTSLAGGFLSGQFETPEGEGAVKEVSLTGPPPPAKPALVRAPLARDLRNYWPTAARIALQVAEALAFAHSKGVLHRDIKPSNILIDRYGRAWIADFGLAKNFELEDLTRSGELVGTLRDHHASRGGARRRSGSRAGAISGATSTAWA